MEEDILKRFAENIRALLEKGDEEGARALIEKEFKNLPEQTQGELLNALYFSGLERKSQEEAVIADVQEKGLAALESLEDGQVAGGSPTKS